MDHDELGAAIGFATFGSVVGIGGLGLTSALCLDQRGRNVAAENTRDLAGPFLRQLPVRAKRERIDRHVVGVADDEDPRALLADFGADLVDQGNKSILDRSAPRCEQASVSDAHQRALAHL